MSATQQWDEDRRTQAQPVQQRLFGHDRRQEHPARLIGAGHQLAVLAQHHMRQAPAVLLAQRLERQLERRIDMGERDAFDHLVLVQRVDDAQLGQAG